MSKAEDIAESWSMEMRKGYARLAALMFLNKKPLTGYDIMKEIEDETMGFWKPTAGGIYPILKEMEKSGYIKGERMPKSKRRKKVYEITGEGRRLLEFALQKQQQTAEAIGGLFREFAREVLGAEIQHTPKIFDFFHFRKSLEKKPIDVQKRILKQARTRMQKAIKLIDEKLEKLEESG